MPKAKRTRAEPNRKESTASRSASVTEFGNVDRRRLVGRRGKQ
jgi:hypothetical protein